MNPNMYATRSECDGCKELRADFEQAEFSRQNEKRELIEKRAKRIKVQLAVAVWAGMIAVAVGLTAIGPGVVYASNGDSFWQGWIDGVVVVTVTAGVCLALFFAALLASLGGGQLLQKTGTLATKIAQRKGK